MMQASLSWAWAFSIVTFTVAQMNFFAANGDVAFDSPVSSACSTALNTTLKCESRWTNYPNDDFGGPFNTTELDGFCAPTCTSSLESYRSDVLTSCKNDVPFEDIPATFVGDRMIAYQNRTCLKDKTSGDYCNGKSFQDFLFSIRNWMLSDHRNYVTIVLRVSRRSSHCFNV